MAEPHVTLFVRRADEEIGATQLPGESGNGALHLLSCRSRIAFSNVFHMFKMHRVVKVGDDDLVGSGNPRIQSPNKTLHDDDIGPRHVRNQRPAVSDNNVNAQIHRSDACQ
ncbi:MAG: hypothetical protein EBR52_03085 [Microbacteriaceae bacterium]|nr:hypothetical protein [Microbacteriaceae bacterium]